MRPPTAPSPAPHTTTRSTAQPSASPYPRSSIARRTPLGADATKMISQRRRPSGGRRVQRASFCLKAAGSCWLYSSMCRNTRRMLRAAFTSRFHRRVAVLVRAVITARRGCRRSFSLFPLCPHRLWKKIGRLVVPASRSRRRVQRASFCLKAAGSCWEKPCRPGKTPSAQGETLSALAPTGCPRGTRPRRVLSLLDECRGGEAAPAPSEGAGAASELKGSGQRHPSAPADPRSPVYPSPPYIPSPERMRIPGARFSQRTDAGRQVSILQACATRYGQVLL